MYSPSHNNEFENQKGVVSCFEITAVLTDQAKIQIKRCTRLDILKEQAWTDFYKNEFCSQPHDLKFKSIRASIW